MRELLTTKLEAPSRPFDELSPVTPWNGTQVAGGKGSMTDAGTRVPLIANWPAGIKQPGRIVDDLVEFCETLVATPERKRASCAKRDSS